MTETEVRLAWTYMHEMWAQFEVPDVETNPGVTAMKVQAWMDVLGDLSFADVRRAVASLAASRFPPPLGQIRERACELAAADRGELSPPDVDEAWGEVARQAQALGRHGEPEWSHAAVGEAVAAIGWTEVCMSENPEALRAHWMRCYESARERWRRHLVPAAPAVAGQLGRGLRSVGSGE